MSYYDQIMQNAYAKANMLYGQYCEGDTYKEVDDYQILHCKQCGEPKQRIVFIALPVPNEELERRKEAYALKHRDLSERDVELAVMNQVPPKHQRRDFGLVGIPCKCQRDAKAGITRAEKSEARRRAIQDNTMVCFPAYALRNETYAKNQENFFIRKVKGYANKWPQMKRQGKGLLLIGTSGSGKTIASLCLANDLLQREVKVLFKVQPEIIGEAQADLNERNKYIQSLIYDYGLLILDDLNLSVLTPAGIEILFQVIDGRVKAKRPLVVTSNASRAEIQKNHHGQDRHIFDRLREACYIVEDCSHDYRRHYGQG